MHEIPQYLLIKTQHWRLVKMEMNTAESRPHPVAGFYQWFARWGIARIMPQVRRTLETLKCDTDLCHFVSRKNLKLSHDKCHLVLLFPTRHFWGSSPNKSPPETRNSYRNKRYAGVRKSSFVGEPHMHRLHCLIKCLPHFFYEIPLIQCPKRTQKGSEHFSKQPLTENHFWTEVRLTIVQSICKIWAWVQKYWCKKP